MILQVMIDAHVVRREEQILVLAGGLTVHNLRDFSGFSEDTAKPQYHAFDSAILDAVMKTDVSWQFLLLSRHVQTLTDAIVSSPQSVRRA